MAITLAHNSFPLLLSLHKNKNKNKNNTPIPLSLISTKTRRRVDFVKVGATQCSANSNPNFKTLKTCKNCKTQFDPSLNNPQACRFHTAHFGGETKRKFESVYAGGTMDTPDSGKVFQYWHCCGSEDPFDPGCTAAPHSSYDD